MASERTRQEAKAHSPHSQAIKPENRACGHFIQHHTLEKDGKKDGIS